MRGAVLQQAIGKAASRGADIDARTALDVDLPMLQGRGQLQSSAAYVRLVLAEQADRGILRNRRPGFVDLLLAHEHAAGKNHRAGALAAGNKAALDEKHVDSRFERVARFPGPVSSGARFARIRHRRSYSLKKLKGRSPAGMALRWIASRSESLLDTNSRPTTEWPGIAPEYSLAP